MGRKKKRKVAKKIAVKSGMTLPRPETAKGNVVYCDHCRTPQNTGEFVSFLTTDPCRYCVVEMAQKILDAEKADEELRTGKTDMS